MDTLLGMIFWATLKSMTASMALRLASIAVGHGVADDALKLHDRLVCVTQVCARGQLVQVDLLGALEGVEQGRGDIRLRLQHRVLDDNGVVDGEDPGPPEGLVGRIAGIGDEGLDVGRVHGAHADGGVDLTVDQHLGQVHLAGWSCDVGGRLPLLDVLVTGEDPGHGAGVHTVLALEDAPDPEAGGHRVAPVDAHLAAGQVLGAGDAGLGVVQDGAVVEGAHGKDRDGGEGLAEGLGAEIGGDGHL